jgi:hypothetical protein
MKILGLKYKKIKSPKTGRIWLDRNIGAGRVAESSLDRLSYGHYLTHREAKAIAKLVKGFRLPTPEEFKAEELKNSIFALSNLGLPMSGYRDISGTTLYYAGAHGYYWSSSVTSAPYAHNLHFKTTALNPANNSNRANGFSVRLIKDK